VTLITIAYSRIHVLTIMSPKISLIIPAWNRAAYVGLAIKSVLAQTRGDFELVVRDDASTDDTLKVAEQAAKGDPRVRIVAGEHAGMPHALNEAAKLVSAPYFGWVDSDDMIAEGALRETAAVLDQRPEVGLVYTNYLNIDTTGTVRGLGHRCQIPYSKDRLLIDFMTFHFRLMRRELFDSVGQLHPDSGFAEDYDLCLRLSEVTSFHHLAKPLYYYRMHRETISHQRRLEQIDASARAVRRALARRKLDDKYELDVEYIARFSLRKTSQ
jgi:glycosyltransferase involved in cell wall biosynthesis